MVLLVPSPVVAGGVGDLSVRAVPAGTGVVPSAWTGLPLASVGNESVTAVPSGAGLPFLSAMETVRPKFWLVATVAGVGCRVMAVRSWPSVTPNWLLTAGGALPLAA